MKDDRIYNKDVVEITTVKRNAPCEPNSKINIFVAVFTTALACLKLYDILEQLGEQVFYYDTDSVIYKTAPGLPDVPTGTFLNQLTDELGGENITVFGSAGPKSYSYKTNGGKTECKNKGRTVRQCYNRSKLN